MATSLFLLLVCVNLGRTPLKINGILVMLRVSFSILHPKGLRAFQEDKLSEMKVWTCVSFGNDQTGVRD